MYVCVWAGVWNCGVQLSRNIGLTGFSDCRDRISFSPPGVSASAGRIKAALAWLSELNLLFPCLSLLNCNGDLPLLPRICDKLAFNIMVICPFCLAYRKLAFKTITSIRVACYAQEPYDMFSFIYWIDILIPFIPAGCVDADRVFHWCVRGGANSQWLCRFKMRQWWKGDKKTFQKGCQLFGLYQIGETKC